MKIKYIDNYSINIEQDEEIEELSSKPDSQESTEKRKLSTDSNTSNSNGTSNGKKIVLNRKTVIEDIKLDEEPKKDKEPTKSIEDAASEKKVIKLSELSMQEVIIIQFNYFFY